MNKSIISNKGKKLSGIRTTKGSDTTSVRSVKRLVFGYCFEISFGITVQHKVSIFKRYVVDQIVKFPSFSFNTIILSE